MDIFSNFEARLFDGFQNGVHCRLVGRQVGREAPLVTYRSAEPSPSQDLLQGVEQFDTTTKRLG
jgi:hypothetical protein